MTHLNPFPSYPSQSLLFLPQSSPSLIFPSFNTQTHSPLINPFPFLFPSPSFFNTSLPPPPPHPSSPSLPFLPFSHHSLKVLTYLLQTPSHPFPFLPSPSLILPFSPHPLPDRFPRDHSFSLPSLDTQRKTPMREKKGIMKTEREDDGDERKRS